MSIYVYVKRNFDRYDYYIAKCEKDILRRNSLREDLPNILALARTDRPAKISREYTLDDRITSAGPNSAMPAFVCMRMCFLSSPLYEGV